MTPDAVLAWLPLLVALSTALGAYVAWRVKIAGMARDVATLMHGDPSNPARRAARIEDVDRWGERVNRNEQGIEVNNTRIGAMADAQHEQSAAIIAHIEAGRREASERDGRLAVQLAEMKGQTDVCAALEKVGERVVGAIKDATKPRGDR